MTPTKTPFTINASPSTDIWRKPPITDTFNAPCNMTPAIPLSTLSSSCITFSMQYKYRYDQGGLLLHLTHPSKPPRWLKTGVEFYQNKPYISTVGCDGFADWSIYPVTEVEVEGTEEKFTMEVSREGDENGVSLWVYLVGKCGERVPLREVAWFFADEEGWDVSVGAMACRPASSEVVGGESLEVKFWDFDLQQVKEGSDMS